MKNINLSQQAGSEADRQIKIRIENENPGPPARLAVELNFPADFLDDKILRAAKKAPDNDDRLESLNGNGLVRINGGTGNWTVWAVAGRKNVVTVRLSNDLDTKKKAANSPQWGQGSLTMEIPRKPVLKNAGFSLSYRFKDPVSGDQIQDSLDVTLLPEGSGAGDKTPVVRLWADQKSPTALDPGTKVKVTWRVDGAVSGILKGPLPGDTQQLTLKDGDAYDLSTGSIYVRVVGSQIYQLLATVKTTGGDKVDVERSLILDIASAGKKGFLHVFPNYILPHGRAKVYWAAWGVSSATLVGGGKSQRLLPAPGGPNRSADDDQEGESDKYFRTRGYDEPVSLQVTQGTKPAETADSKTVYTLKWDDIMTEGLFQQIRPIPLGLAVAWSETKKLGKLVGCTYSGLWMADVGLGDYENREANLKKRLENVALGDIAEWFGVTALGEGFAALVRPKAGGDLALVRFDLDKKEISRKTLPGSVRSWLNHQNAVADLLVVGSRLYIRAAMPWEDFWHAEAWSTDGLNDRDGWKNEPLLAGLPGYRLAAIGESLCALHPASGNLLQFTRQKDGNLGGPKLAARAVDGQGRSLVSTGLPAGVGKVLVVLGSPRQKNTQGDEPKEPTDWVYSPQTNRWTDDCGQGLPLEVRAWSAYRNTESKRLWIATGARLQTLSVVNGENTFVHDYIEGNQVRELPDYFDETCGFSFTNHLPFDIMATDAICQAAGCLDTMSAQAAGQLTFASGDSWQALGRNATANLTLRYRKDDPPVFRFNWRIGGFPDPNAGNVLQVTARPNKKPGGGIEWTVTVALLYITLRDGKPSVEIIQQSTSTGTAPKLEFSFLLPAIKKTQLDMAFISPTALSPDGKYAYGANARNGGIWLSKLDLATQAVVKSVNPWGALDPNEALAMIAAAGPPSIDTERRLARLKGLIPGMIAAAEPAIYAVVGNRVWAFDEALNAVPLSVPALIVGNARPGVEVVREFTICGITVSDRKAYLAGGVFVQPMQGDRNWMAMDYLAVVDLDNPSNKRLLPLPKDGYWEQWFGHPPVPMVPAKDGKKVYAGLRDDNTLVIQSIMYGPDEQRMSYAGNLKRIHYCLCISADGQRMYTVSDAAPQLLSVRLSDLTVEKSLTFEGFPKRINLAAYGPARQGYSVGRYYRNLPPVDVLESPNGAELIVAYGNSIKIIDQSSWTIRQTIPLGTGLRLIKVVDGPLNTWKIYAWGRAVLNEREGTMDNSTVLYEILVAKK